MRPSTIKASNSKIYVLMTTTSFPISKTLISGLFVERLEKAISQLPNIRIKVLAPDGSSNRGHSTQRATNVSAFRYAPRRWQTLAHSPGGIPIALKKQPLLWLLLPLFIVSFFVATWRHSRDVSIIHANWAVTGVISGWAGGLRGIPVCTTLRGSDVASLKNSALTRIIIRLLLATNTFVITVNRSMAEELRHAFPSHSGKIKYIPNGVSSDLFSFPPSNPGETIKLIVIGNLIPGKAVHTAIESLRHAGPEFTLTIVGDGPQRRQLGKLTNQLGLEARINFLGNRPAEEIPKLLAEHDALLLTSLSEGRPNVVLEAMAAGRAVISSRLPGVEELIEHRISGLLFTAGDLTSLCCNLRLLSQTPNLIPKLGIAARQAIINQGLTWERSAAQYANLYLYALKKNQPCAD